MFVLVSAVLVEAGSVGVGSVGVTWRSAWVPAIAVSLDLDSPVVAGVVGSVVLLLLVEAVASAAGSMALGVLAVWSGAVLVVSDGLFSVEAFSGVDGVVSAGEVGSFGVGGANSLASGVVVGAGSVAGSVEGWNSGWYSGWYWGWVGASSLGVVLKFESLFVGVIESSVTGSVTGSVAGSVAGVKVLEPESKFSGVVGARSTAGSVAGWLVEASAPEGVKVTLALSAGVAV